ncbi:MAG: FAD-binding protein [Acidobacteria bacterium]|nr:FAD-binding protein [Acidobacteriota bacterium]
MKTFDVVIIGAGLAGLSCAVPSQRAQKPSSTAKKISRAVHTTGIFVRKTLRISTFPTERSAAR